MFESLKNRKAKKPLGEIPEIMKPENPVNYNSVLDYLTGLSKEDYGKIIKSANIYRDANAKVAKVVGIEDTPTHELMPSQPDDEQIDKDLDNMLEADDLSTAFLDDDAPGVDSITKPQAPKPAKKIEIAD